MTLVEEHGVSASCGRDRCGLHLDRAEPDVVVPNRLPFELQRTGLSSPAGRRRRLGPRSQHHIAPCTTGMLAAL